MSILEVLKNHKPVENAEFGQKKRLVGDAVCQVASLEKITSKKGASWIVLKTNVIHAIPDAKGRETTLMAGDEISKVYDPTDAEALQELDNDLFTAGIDYSKDVNTEEEILATMSGAAKDKLIYFRTWVKDKPEAKRESGKPDYYQNMAIKSKNLITPENSVPQLPF